MDYRGRYKIFDSGTIKTYPVKMRKNKVLHEDLVRPEEVMEKHVDNNIDKAGVIEKIARKIIACRSSNNPIILFTGAHLVKNGLSLLLIDLIKKKLITLVAGNGATAIHDYELCLIGQTSEDVPDALEKGQFGMAYEFNQFNKTMDAGNALKLGLGESLGRLINDRRFQDKIFGSNRKKGDTDNFIYPGLGVASACYLKGIPFTVHAGIGTDVIDQHHTFDGGAKGACSGRDFLIFTREVSRLSRGGVYLNIGSAVTGPEVLLKAVSMCANTGKKPNNTIFADFDIRPQPDSSDFSEESFFYYFRDQKSIARRVPEAFGCNGYYVQGNIIDTFKALYKKIIILSD